MAFKIRLFRQSDWQHGFRECLNALSPTPELERWQVTALTLARKQRGIKTFVAVNETRQVIATSSLLLEPKFIRGGLYTAHIEDVAVHPDFQLKGLGSAMMKYCIKEAKKGGMVYKIILDCSPEIEPFYEKLGFKKSANQMRLDI